MNLKQGKHLDWSWFKGAGPLCAVSHPDPHGYLTGVTLFLQRCHLPRQEPGLQTGFLTAFHPGTR